MPDITYMVLMYHLQEESAYSDLIYLFKYKSQGDNQGVRC